MVKCSFVSFLKQLCNEKMQQQPFLSRESWQQRKFWSTFSFFSFFLQLLYFCNFFISFQSLIFLWEGDRKKSFECLLQIVALKCSYFFGLKCWY
jgi:hypothetical protein